MVHRKDNGIYTWAGVVGRPAGYKEGSLEGREAGLKSAGCLFLGWALLVSAFV